MLEETGKIELISDIEEVPDLEEFDDEHKDKPKLIVFDDFLNLQKKDMKNFFKYLIAGRKFGWSVWLMAQDYVSSVNHLFPPNFATTPFPEFLVGSAPVSATKLLASHLLLLGLLTFVFWERRLLRFFL
jgi:hypothetical protein